MPPALPVTTATMNYIVVIIFGLFAIFLVLWFLDGRVKFEGPHIDWDLLKEANENMLKEDKREQDQVYNDKV